MSYEFYKLFHILGIALLFASLGGALIRREISDERASLRIRKTIGISHGLALLFLLVSGFGMIARIGASMAAPWIYIKLLIWFLLAGILFLINRAKGTLSTVLWIVLPIFAVLAGYVALYKPFTN